MLVGAQSLWSSCYNHVITEAYIVIQMSNIYVFINNTMCEQMKCQDNNAPSGLYPPHINTSAQSSFHMGKVSRLLHLQPEHLHK